MNSERIDLLEPRDQMTSGKPMTTAELAGRGSDAQDLMPKPASSTDRVALFPVTELGDFRHRWQNIQSSFVDDPRSAVRTADELVAPLMTRLAQVFADERAKLEHEWDKGENVSTEELRLALLRYRSFFDRLLCV